MSVDKPLVNTASSYISKGGREAECPRTATLYHPTFKYKKLAHTQLARIKEQLGHECHLILKKLDKFSIPVNGIAEPVIQSHVIQLAKEVSGFLDYLKNLKINSKSPEWEGFDIDCAVKSLNKEIGLFIETLHGQLTILREEAFDIKQASMPSQAKEHQLAYLSTQSYLIVQQIDFFISCKDKCHSIQAIIEPIKQLVALEADTQYDRYVPR